MDTVGIIIIAWVLLLGSAFGLWRRHRDGRFRPAVHPLGAVVRPDSRPTFVQFSGEYCAQCRRNKAVFERLGGTDFRFIELAVEDNEELVQTLKIRRTPTVFFMNPEVVARTEGALSAKSIKEALANG